jgi:hypothetical protein
VEQTEDLAEDKNLDIQCDSKLTISYKGIDFHFSTLDDEQSAQEKIAIHCCTQIHLLQEVLIESFCFASINI